MKTNWIIINLPPYINYVLIENKKTNFINLYLYNETYFIKLYFNKFLNNINIDKESNTIEIDRNLFLLNKIYLSNVFNIFLKSLNIYFYYKIKFKGKGYRIRFFKKNKIMKFFFGKSHLTVIKFNKTFIKKIGKYKFIIKKLNLLKVKHEIKKIIKIKKINLFTLRGLRLSRQIIFKRKGKKSSYI